MIDHLLAFPDEVAARKVLPGYWLGDLWRGDCCIPGLSVYAVTGTETLIDSVSGEKYERELRQSYPGWFIVVALVDLDFTLRDLSDNACRLITDREAAARGEDFICYIAPDLAPESLAVARVEPLFAGALYPFGTK